MNSPAPASASSHDRFVFWITAISLIGALAVWSLSWTEPILDRHEFRQTQTAYSAYWIRESGWRLDYETPVFGPPWSIPMEFPLYQMLVAGLSTMSGLSLESAGRLVSIISVLATLPAIYLLAGVLGLPARLRLLPIAALLTCPTYLFYGRAFMIETTATCLAAWFLAAFAQGFTQRNLRWFALAVVCGIAAALAKVTTLAIAAIAAVLFAAWWHFAIQPRAPGDRWLPPVRVLLAVAAALLLPVLAGWWWVRHGDAVKATNPFATFLLSKNMTEFNWGTLGQRVSPALWAENWRNFRDFIVGEPTLYLLVLAAGISGAGARRLALGTFLAFLAGPLTFANLYYFHDYYYSANACWLMLGIGIVLAGALQSDRVPRRWTRLLVVLVLTAQISTFWRGYGDYHLRDLPDPPALSPVVREVTAPEDIVLIYGWDWNTLVPYYAQRRVVMVRDGQADDLQALEKIVQQLGRRRIAAMVVRGGAFKDSPQFLRWRTDRFLLSPTPIATSEEGDLYLAEDLVPAALDRLTGRKFDGVQNNLAETETAAPPLPSVDVATLDLAIFSPRPQAARSQFGLSAGDHEGQLVLNAHAPSELEFDPPAGAQAISAQYGLLPGAYAGGPAVSDGIGVEIFERRPDGRRRSLFRRQLDPARREQDRGTQQVVLPDAGPFRGRLVFRFTTGPGDNVVNDWAYWAGIDIR